MAFNRRRIGIITIEDSMFVSRLDEVKLIMQNMIVVRAEHMFAIDCIRYMAISEWFDILDEGEYVPFYTFLMCGPISTGEKCITGVQRYDATG